MSHCKIITLMQHLLEQKKFQILPPKSKNKVERLKRGVFFLTLFVVLTPNFLWAPSSLFFTDEEILQMSKEKTESPMSEKLSLLGILYVDPYHWTLWINDKIIRPDNPCELRDFCIEKVFSNKVVISSLSSKEKIILQPYPSIK